MEKWVTQIYSSFFFLALIHLGGLVFFVCLFVFVLILSGKRKSSIQRQQALVTIHLGCQLDKL